MRLLLVSDSFPPLIGGATRFMRQLADGLRDRGHDVAVATAAQADHRVNETVEGMRVFRIADLSSRLSILSSDSTRHTPPPWTDPQATVQLDRVVRTVRPDLVFSYGWSSYAASVAAARHGVPFVLSCQDYCQVCPKRTLLYKDDSICTGPGPGKCLRCASEFYGTAKGALSTLGVRSGARVLSTRISGITFASRYMQERFMQDMPAIAADPGVSQVVIPAFAEPSAGESGPDEEILRSLPSNYIMYVGALRRVKGVELLAKAYADLEDPPPLVLFGTRAPDTPKLDGERITVIEGAQNATVMAAWENALFGVMPSLWAEPLGIVVHEGMSRGRPVIGTTPGGHADMITDGRTGFLTPVGDQAALTAAMRTLIDDPDRREQMGRDAREAARRFESGPILDEFEAFFDLVDSRAQRGSASARGRAGRAG